MRTTYLALCLLAATPSWAAAQQVAATQFWLAPKVDLDLRLLAPADVKLVAGPDQTRNFALLPPSGSAPSANYVPGNTTLAPFVVQNDSGYRIVPGGLKVGAPPYGDRTYKIDQLDASFSGLTLLQTKMWRKSILDGSF